MRISIEKRERATVVSIDGSIDGTTAADLAAGVERSDDITMLAARRANSAPA